MQATKYNKQSKYNKQTKNPTKNLKNFWLWLPIEQMIKCGS